MAIALQTGCDMDHARLVMFVEAGIAGMGRLRDVLAREHAAEWNLDPQRLGIIGFSAGGNLAAKTSTPLEERRSPPSMRSIGQLGAGNIS